MKYYNQLTLEELLAKTLLELDLLHEEVDRNVAGLQATGLNTLLRALVDLRQDGPLSQTAAEAIRLVHSIFDPVIAGETLGHRNAFDGMNDPDLGASGRVAVVPILSHRGEILIVIRAHFRKILAMRELLAARIDAESQIARCRAA
ncbi:hypothetical protein [Pseudorhodobacter sp.]|uniref:hypothetical protein n=1 Tax=Pseudorhodobacter sp. TaxID=1934400 RepID=UPI002648789A|nr:hypothetical protein [Pseudorhodobacter sp.]MDN5787836.1 hypothetical protein [Pseudorhodobacter sp.]